MRERERDSDDVRRRRGRGRIPTTPSLLCMTTTKTATAEGQKSKERKGRGREGGREGEPTTELSRPLPMDRVGGGGVVSRRARTNDFIGGRGMPLRRREGGGTTANNHRRRRRHFRLTGGTKGRALARAPRSVRVPSKHGKGEFVRLSLFHIHVIAISEACRSIEA